MSFNTDTENLIIIAFNPGAGGKFLQSCLALDANCLHPLEVYAKNKFHKMTLKNKKIRLINSLLTLQTKHASSFFLLPITTSIGKIFLTLQMQSM